MLLNDSLPSRPRSPPSSGPYNPLRHYGINMAIRPDEPKERKPRIRHTDAQLAALNNLYEENEHPSLEERAVLAEGLGMEPKAVNAWFANKRSATKKKSRNMNHPYSTPPPHTSHVEDEYDSNSRNHSRLSTPLSVLEHQYHATPEAEVSVDNRHVFDGEFSPGTHRRMRIRPTPKQREELERLFESNTHPSREEREALGDRIGMRYQSVTNWFQNMRSVMKRRQENGNDLEHEHEHDQEAEEDQEDNISVHSTENNDYETIGRGSDPRSLTSYSSFPPATSHPSLNISSHPNHSPATQHLSLTQHSNDITRPAPTRRVVSGGPLSRSRRTRPEPYQLDALKRMYARNPNPSIEERGALALEIGMDIGKVTNWFRNLRQTARKRALKTHDDEESMDYDESAPVSRASTPQLASTLSSYSSSSVDDDVEHMDLDVLHYHGRVNHHSDGGSEEEFEEAVTPPPAPPRVTGRRRMDVGFLTGSNDDLHITTQPSKSYVTGPSAEVAGPPSVEDALLLLGFSQRIAN